MIPSLQTLAFGAFAQDPFPETQEAKKFRFQTRFPLSQFEKMHSLICQQIINSMPKLLDHLTYFFDPFVLGITCSVVELEKANPHLSPMKIINIFLSVFPNLKALNLSKIKTIAQLETLPKIEELTLSTDSMTHDREWLRIGHKFPHLKKMTFAWCDYTKITTSQQKLVHILKGLKGLPLEGLDIQWGPVFYPSSLPLIKMYLPRLKELSIRLYSENIQDPISLNGLAGLQLKALYIQEFTDLSIVGVNQDICSIPVQELRTLKSQLPHLKKLDIDFQRFRITDNGSPITSLKGLTGLPFESLNLSYNLWGDVVYALKDYLTINEKFSHLKNVSLAQQICITSLRGLRGLPLEVLNINGCVQIPKEEFLTLNQEFFDLKKLYLAGTSIASLGGLKGLLIETLNLNDCKKIPAEAFLTLNQKLPELKELYLAGTSIASLEGLKGLPLQRLNLDECTGIPKGEIRALIKNLSEIFPSMNPRNLSIDGLEDGMDVDD